MLSSTERCSVENDDSDANERIRKVYRKRNFLPIHFCSSEELNTCSSIPLLSSGQKEDMLAPETSRQPAINGTETRLLWRTKSDVVRKQVPSCSRGKRVNKTVAAVVTSTTVLKDDGISCELGRRSILCQASQ